MNKDSSWVEISLALSGCALVRIPKKHIPPIRLVRKRHFLTQFCLLMVV